MRRALIAILAAAALAAPASAAAQVLQTNSKNGSAIVTAENMKPGDTVSDTVTIANPTGAPAAYVLSTSNLVDTPAAGGAKLSERLQIAIEDSKGATVYAGPIGAAGERQLGSFAGGESRTYRFTVSFPKGSDGNALAGARMSVEFDWLAQQAAQDVQGEQEKGGAPDEETAGGGEGDGSDGAGDVAGEEAEDGDGAAGSGDGDAGTSAGGLPFTGLELGFAAIAGALLLGAGRALRRRTA
jgi:spore coat-associated protein N